MKIYKQRVYGYTLLELLITLAITTIASTFGISSLKSTMSWHTDSRSIISEIKTARGQATTLNQPIIVCTLNYDNECEGITSHLNTFADVNNNKKYDTGDIWLSELTLDTIELKWRKDRRFIRFRPDGTVWGYFGTLRLCSDGGKRLAITLSATGRSRVFTPSAKECSSN